MADVFDVVFHHYQSFDTATPGKTGVFVWVYISLLSRRSDESCHSPRALSSLSANKYGNPSYRRMGNSKRTRRWFGKRKIKWLGHYFQLLAVVFLQKSF